MTHTFMVIYNFINNFFLFMVITMNKKIYFFLSKNLILLFITIKILFISNIIFSKVINFSYYFI